MGPVSLYTKKGCNPLLDCIPAFLSVHSISKPSVSLLPTTSYYSLIVGSVPSFQEVAPVIAIDLANEARDCRVAVNLVLRCHQWVVVGIIREVLCYVAFRDD